MVGSIIVSLLTIIVIGLYAMIFIGDYIENRRTIEHVNYMRKLYEKTIWKK